MDKIHISDIHFYLLATDLFNRATDMNFKNLYLVANWNEN